MSPGYKVSIFEVYTIKIEIFKAVVHGLMEAAGPQTLPDNLLGPYE